MSALHPRILLICGLAALFVVLGGLAIRSGHGGNADGAAEESDHPGTVSHSAHFTLTGEIHAE